MECRYAWLFSLFKLGRLAPAGPGTKDAGLDLAGRCTDSTLAFFTLQLPLAASIKQSIDERLQQHRQNSTSPAGSAAHDADVPGAHALRALLQWQVAIFSGGAYNANESPGYDSIKTYSRAPGGDLQVHQHDG